MFRKSTILVAIILALTSFNFGQNCAKNAEAKTAFRGLSDVQKAKVWKAHFQFILRTESLTPLQEQVVYEAIALTKPKLFMDGADQQPVVALSERIKVNFTNDLAATIFESLSVGEAKGNAFVPIAYTPKMPFAVPDCNCNDAAHPLCDYCELGEEGSCVTSRSGCGPFWIFTCDGRCWKDGHPV